MGKRKIINDPIYGFIHFDNDLIYDLIDHPLFQRLRRISQMGMSFMVYPGAVHSRFQHALGACHLMSKAINVLRNKNIDISDDEAEGASIAILLHDIGHGPFSHGLEQKIIPFHHEDITLKVMHLLNEEFEGKLSTAISIFKGVYHKKFLHQLVSSQLDMDRMDYLIRDSFYTGVAEGVVGYDRIINMLNVVGDQIVIEEKAIFSVEKFMLSRSMMYWQVYLHKTAIAAEQMLVRFVELLKKTHRNNKNNSVHIPESFSYCIESENSENESELLEHYLKLDDHDIFYLLKCCQNHTNNSVSFYAKSILKRSLFKIILSDSEIASDLLAKTRQKIVDFHPQNEDFGEDLLITGFESNQTYDEMKNEIIVMSKNGDLIPLSLRSTILSKAKLKRKHFLCYPKYIV